MSHYTKEVAKIRAEERVKAKALKKAQKAEAKMQEEAETIRTLEAKYNQQFLEDKFLLEGVPHEYRERFAYDLSKKIRLNEAKLKDNKKRLVKANKKICGVDTLWYPLGIGLSAVAGVVLGTELANIVTGESYLTMDSDILYNSALVGAMATASLNGVCEITRPVSKLQCKKAQKNIQELDMENEYLNKIKEHVINTYGISVPPKGKESTSACDTSDMEM